MVTMSQLTLGHPSRGDPRVNQLMWTGSKHVDSKVPTGPLQGAMAALGASYQVGSRQADYKLIDIVLEVP